LGRQTGSLIVLSARMPMEDVPMAMIKCDICGQICSQSYLSSHKRLAHTKPQPVVSTAHEPETVQAILLLYGQLSDSSQEVVRERMRESMSPTRRRAYRENCGKERIQ
jgi:hypothetical protein